jgi:protein-disulfide isomerase
MAAEGARRRRLLQVAAGAVFLAIVVVAVLIVVNVSSGGSGGDTRIEQVRAVDRLLRGIPQYGLLLGDPQAPVEVVEFGDLQCPVCRSYAEEILPPIIATKVRRGEVKIDFRNFTVVGAQSLPAGAAALAAGTQSRGWNYLEIFYRNQGPENTGYADEPFLRAVARAAGVTDLEDWLEAREEVVPEVENHTAEARELGFTGTPSFLIRGPGNNFEHLKLEAPSSAELEAAIEKASP